MVLTNPERTLRRMYCHERYKEKASQDLEFTDL